MRRFRTVRATVRDIREIKHLWILRRFLMLMIEILINENETFLTVPFLASHAPCRPER